MKEHPNLLFMVCLACCLNAAETRDRLTGVSPSHGELCLPTSISTCKKKLPHRLDLLEGIVSFKFPFPEMTLACVKLRKKPSP